MSISSLLGFFFIHHVHCYFISQTREIGWSSFTLWMSLCVRRSSNQERLRVFKNTKDMGTSWSRSDRGELSVILGHGWRVTFWYGQQSIHLIQHIDSWGIRRRRWPCSGLNLCRTLADVIFWAHSCASSKLFLCPITTWSGINSVTFLLLFL